MIDTFTATWGKMHANNTIKAILKILVLFTLLFGANKATLAQRYRMILPPAPLMPPPLNNTVQPQIANQNVNFNTGNSIIGGSTGIGGGVFSQNSGGVQGTIQYTQNNTPGMRIHQLYQIPLSTGFVQSGGVFNQGNQFGGFNGIGQFGGGLNQGVFGGGQFGGGFNQNNGVFFQGNGMGMSGRPIGFDNPYYQMAMQGITAGVSGSAFSSGGQFGGGQFGYGQFGQFNNGGFGNNQFGNNQFGNNQFGNNQFGFGGGFNNGGNGL